MTRWSRADACASASARVLGAIALSCLTASAAVAAPSARAQVPGGAGRFFVAPFEVEARTPRTYWVGEAAAILVADELIALGADTIDREGRIAALEELRLPESASLARATQIRVAESVNATELVAGRVALSDHALAMRARLLHLSTGTYGTEIVEEGRPADLFALSRRMAARLLAEARGLGSPAPGADLPAPSPAAPVLEAFESYVKGLLDERPEARIRLLEASLARQPGFDRARLALWEARTRAGQHEAAFAAAQAVDRQSPLGRKARFLAALSLMDLARHDEAFASLAALAAEQPLASVHNNLGVIQQRRGPTPGAGRAVYYFTQASEADPDDPDIYFNLGYAYWFESNAEAAIYWLREAVRRNPLDADAHLVLAAALSAAGAAVEAERERELAGRLAARYEDWVRRGNAVDHVPRGLERVRGTLTPLRGVAFDSAITAAAQRDARELTAFYLERGRRFAEQQRDAEAIGELRRALYLSPYESEAHLLLGSVFLRSGRHEEAVTALRVSLWSREDARARLALAQALLAGGNKEAARVEAQRALALDPGSAEARALVAKLNP